MSLPPNLLDNILAPAPKPARPAPVVPFPRARRWLVWIVLMLAMWLLLGAGVYAFLMPGV